MKSKYEIAKNWLPRYTGMPLEKFGDFVLLTNFSNYIELFAERFGVEQYGEDRPMQAATNHDGLTIINFGIGSANAATIMDLLSARMPRAALFLGKCGGLKKSTEIGNFLLPIAAIRGEGTSNDYLPPEVPALPSFQLHKYVSDHLNREELDYRTGVIYTTNRRVWEHDLEFRERLDDMGAMAIDMETATLFIAGFTNKIPRGALLLVSDVPLTPDGIKTEKSDKEVTRKWTDIHLNLGIESMEHLSRVSQNIKHFQF